MPTREYVWAVLDNPDKRFLIERKAKELDSDGCTGVPDFYVIACWWHDICYRTHCDFNGQPVTKREADTILRWSIQHESTFGRLSPMAFWRHQAMASKCSMRAWVTFGGTRPDLWIDDEEEEPPGPLPGVGM